MTIDLWFVYFCFYAMLVSLFFQETSRFMLVIPVVYANLLWTYRCQLVVMYYSWFCLARVKFPRVWATISCNVLFLCVAFTDSKRQTKFITTPAYHQRVVLCVGQSVTQCDIILPAIERLKNYQVSDSMWHHSPGNRKTEELSSQWWNRIGLC